MRQPSDFHFMNTVKIVSPRFGHFYLTITDRTYQFFSRQSINNFV